MGKYIKRHIDKNIRDWDVSNSKALMIIGARQVGKTESIRQFLREKYNLEEGDTLPEINIAEINRAKEMLIKGESEYDNVPFIQYLFTELNISVDLSKMNIIFIDEIQELSNDKQITSSKIIKEIIKRLLATPDYRFILSGSLLGSKISNLNNIANEIKEITQYKMYPLTFDEFTQELDGSDSFIVKAKENFFKNEDIEKKTHIHLLERFAEYSFVGGMPKAVLAYSQNDEHKVSNSMTAIKSLVDTYNDDIQKYFREEYNANVGANVFNTLLFGLKQNDKRRLMKQLKEPEKLFYKYVVNSDVGLLVPNIAEKDLDIDSQTSPKTYFNDIGFLRCLVEEYISGMEDKNNPPKEIKPYYDKRNLDDQKKGFVQWIKGDSSNKPNNNGAYFEQLIAQNIKANGFEYVYYYKRKPEAEIEFILNDILALEVKSGGFKDYKSSLQYAQSGKKV